jgi:multisubunit Na+/H+ antiporter MnhF subunit
VIKLDGCRLRHAVLNFQPTGVIAMRTDNSHYVDSILVVALVMLALTGAMAINRFLTSDSTAEVIQFQTVRY